MLKFSKYFSIILMCYRSHTFNVPLCFQLIFFYELIFFLCLFFISYSSYRCSFTLSELASITTTATCFYFLLLCLFFVYFCFSVCFVCKKKSQNCYKKKKKSPTFSFNSISVSCEFLTTNNNNSHK